MATNQQRREAAKRKLERQLERRAERAKRNRAVAAVATAGAVVVIAGLIVFFATRGGGDESAADPGTETSQPPESSAAQASGDCTFEKTGQEPAKKVTPPQDGKAETEGVVDVTIESSAGDIGLTLDRAKAPCTVRSMVSLIEQDYFDGTACHRIDTENLHMLQCGDPTGQGSGGPGYSVPDEFPQSPDYRRGTLAMANSGQPNSGGSQFFMVYGDAPLPPQYTIFGTISEDGLKVLDEVAKAGHDGRYDPQPGGGKPKTPVKFSDVTING